MSSTKHTYADFRFTAGKYLRIVNEQRLNTAYLTAYLLSIKQSGTIKSFWLELYAVLSVLLYES